MNRHPIRVGSMAATLLSLAACILASMSGCIRTAPTPGVLTEQDAGRTIELRAGGVFQVALRGNPSTGFGWYADSLDTNILEQQGDWEFDPDNSSPGVSGSGGTFSLDFKAVGSGMTSLQLVYRRPWEPDVPPIQTFEVTVVVSDQ
jgi:inhibitor of cysteine peptidase